ncbi:MAG: FGGY-family carbohydrate kinase, partial [Spirochaetia bacterium]
NSRGSFVGMGSTTSRGDMLRALIEGLDYQLLDIITEMRKSVGFEVEKVVVVGGAAHNAFWMQNKADMIGRSIEVPEVEDASPLGAAMLAGIGVGIYRDEKDAFERVRKPARTYHPDLRVTSRYAELFPLYKSLYPALKPVSHAVTEKLRA